MTVLWSTWRNIARFESARLVHPTPWSVEELSGLLTDGRARACTQQNGLLAGHRGTGPRKHSLQGAAGQSVVAVRPLELTPLDGSYSAITRPDLRYALCHVKTINLLPNAGSAGGG